ncbi:hypothetical protein HK405_008715 [Cladochytrium tenue]|nr:hypothetical protein HK405_008715 [Cladochytrium tenue]
MSPFAAFVVTDPNSVQQSHAHRVRRVTRRARAGAAHAVSLSSLSPQLQSPPAVSPFVGAATTARLPPVSSFQSGTCDILVTQTDMRKARTGEHKIY